MKREFKKIEKRLKEYWGFQIFDKGTYFKTRYCVVNDLRGTRYIGYRSLKEIEKIYLREDTK